MKTRNMTTLHLRKSSGPATAGRGFLLIPLLLGLFALSPTARAQLSPAPDGGYPGFNTAEGTNALFSRTTGVWNTALGYQAIFKDTTGNTNTAVGLNALYNNTTGSQNVAIGVQALQSNTASGNTATGYQALFSNTIGINNTATGDGALLKNTTGNFNTANGGATLLSNTTGSNNTADGDQALYNNTTGSQNVAIGVQALQSNNGSYNTANGDSALFSNTIGVNNTADGWGALFSNTTGSSNIALGVSAGVNLTTGSNNIDIGNAGVAGESAKIRIGKNQKNTFIAGINGVTVARGVGVIVDSTGHLGTVVSSARFKDEIKPMDKASEAVLALKPVTFRYKHELDPDGIPQFGLVAEQVEKVNPDLVARDAQGKPYTVRYEAVNAMLLNEFLKEHGQVQEQQKQIENLTAQLKEQAAQIRKVSDKVELSKPAPQTVGNNQ